MQIKAQDIASLLDGVVEGDPNVMVHQPAKIEEAKAGSITFLANPDYEQYAYTTKASILLVKEDFKPRQTIKATLIRVKDVYAALAILLEAYNPAKRQHTNEVSKLAAIDNTATIGENNTIKDYVVIGKQAQIGDNCMFYPQVFIGENVKIGNRVTLYPGVKIYHSCEIGDDCTIHANTVIGSDGFGFSPNADGTFKKIPQIGNVSIENNVEIGANVTIDRATMGSTHIKSGVKLDNLIQIAHNVVIGENTGIAAQVGIAGSTKIGKHCLIGGQVGIAGHLEIKDGTKIMAQSGIMRSTKKKNTTLFGYPAIEAKDYLKSFAVFKELPKLKTQIQQLLKDINQG